ncbi:MAG TPA: T9SS type A sorting domain-containing protein [Flavobacteriales bacterium]
MIGLGPTTGVPAQFAPPAGQPGTTALHADSSAFLAWAVACSTERGPMDLSDPAAGNATYGEASDATGPPDGSAVISLGDGGRATLTFAQAITNGPGWDFAVFENGLNDTFLELAFVEVSSDGSAFFRFPATSNTQTEVQINAFGTIDATQVDNLAGKYRALYGTPFDLGQLIDTPGLDVQAITHVRIVDVVGCIQESYATHDHQGRKVNDPWSTAFASSGFDLDAVGVIHHVPTSIGDGRSAELRASLFPNPARDRFHLRTRLSRSGTVRVLLQDMTGRLREVLSEEEATPGGYELTFDATALPAGSYFITLLTDDGRIILPLIVP